MTREPRTDAVAALCRALDGRDVGPLASWLDDASVLRFPGLSGLGGDYQGGEAIVGLLQRMAAATDGTLHFEVDRTASPRTGASHIQGRLSGTRDGRPFRADVSVAATLTDERFRSIDLDCLDRAGWDALWGHARP